MPTAVTPQTLLYRATGPGASWTDVLSGIGTRHLKKQGNRFNPIRSKFTSYVSPSPLVAVAEAAYYGAVYVQSARLPLYFSLPGTAVQMTYSRVLWCFTLTAPANPAVEDAADPAVRAAHGNYPPFLLRNPSQAYRATQDVGQRVRASGADVLAAPSVRASIKPLAPVRVTSAAPYAGPNGRDVPCGLRRSSGDSVVLFHGKRHKPTGRFVRAWALDIVFLDHDRNRVTATSDRIDWDLPQFRLSSLTHPPTTEPPHVGIRDHGIEPDEWYDVHVRFD